MKKLIGIVLLVVGILGCVNEHNDKEEIGVQKIEINTTSTSVTIGEEINLFVNIEPSNASNKNIVWESSNTEIVKVNNSGKILGISEGSATISAISSDKSVIDNCIVSVKKIKYEISLITTTGAPFRNIITENDGYIINSSEKMIKLNKECEKNWEINGYFGEVIKSDVGYISNQEGSMKVSKIGKDGDILWKNNYNPGYYYSAITNSNDGGCIIIGNNETTPVAIKIDYYGNKIWEKTYSDIKNIKSIIEIKEEGYLISGMGSNSNGTTTRLLKIDYEGNIIWNKNYSNSYSQAMIQTTDKGYMVVGWSYGNINGQLEKGEQDLYVIKINNKGGTEWERLFGGNMNDRATDVIQSKDGGYIVIGYTLSTNINNNKNNNGGKDIYIIKIDSKGNKVYEKTYGTEKHEEAIKFLSNDIESYTVASIEIEQNGNDSRTYLIKIDENGEKVKF